MSNEPNFPNLPVTDENKNCIDEVSNTSIQENLDDKPSFNIATEDISLDTTFSSWEEAKVAGRNLFGIWLNV